MSLTPGTRVGSYEIISLLGAGGMGEVYKAQDVRLDRTVAIKVLPSTDRHLQQRFEREAWAISALDHPHICTLYDVLQENGANFLIMQYVEGETLAERLSRGAVPLDQALRYAIEIADGLAHAHSRGIVHRDLKPGNIMLTKSGAKLLDFGLAKLQQPANLAAVETLALTQRAGLTAEGTILGTLHYMAPEQLEGKEADARSDLFAFGVVLYEMVTGTKAFDGGSPATIIAAILTMQPPAPSARQPMTPPALDHVVTGCLAKSPEDRWQSSADVKRDLRWISESAARTDLTLTGPRSSRWAIAIGATIALVGGVVIGAAAWSRVPIAATHAASIARSTVATPTGAVLDFSGSTSSLAVSPDGTQVAYIVRRGETSTIYLRALDEFDAKPVAGAEGAESLFFSPDSRWLGFSVPGKVKKVAVSGGAPQTICDVSARFGASWGSGDVVVVAPTREGLSKCSAAGSTPQVLTYLDPAKHEKSHRWPQFLPDGRSLLFTIVPSDIASFDESRIALVSLDTGRVRILLDGGVSPRFVATGHLLYVRGASLFAVPFDLRRLEVTGRSVPVVDGVMTDAGSGFAEFAVADNGLLAYAAGRVVDSDRRVVWVDRDGRTDPLIDLQRPFTALRLSPDGKWLAVTINGANDQVWLYDLARQTLSRLTSAWDNSPIAWTPDGRHLVLRSGIAGQHKTRFQLSWLTPDGSGPLEVLNDGSDPIGGGSWSPDGKLFVYSSSSINDADILLLAAGPPLTVRSLIQTPFTELDPRLSPDGRWLAYTSTESGELQVYVQRFPGLAGKRQISTNGGSTPIWEPRGREIFYQNHGKMMAVAIQTQPTFVAGRPRLLFDGSFETGSGNVYDVAPDGRFIMIQRGASEAPVMQIAVVQNWFEELKRRVPR